MQGTRRKRIRPRRALARTLLAIAVLVVLFFNLAPIYWMLASSLQPVTDLLTTHPHWIPVHWDLASYRGVFSAQGQASVFLLALRNSTLVALGATLITVVIAALAGYPLARMRFRGRETVLIGVLAMQMVPQVVLLIPLFQMMRRASLLNTHLALQISYTTFTVPLAIWLMAAYFQSIPAELEEAAVIDGCSTFGAFRRVVLPLSLPGLASVAIFSVLSSWDEFLFALTFTSTSKSTTIPVALAEFVGQHHINYQLMVTGGVLATIVPAILVMVFQDRIVSGLTAGSIK